MAIPCPVCLSIDGFDHHESGGGGFGDTRNECDVCGLFICHREAKEDYLGTERKKTTPYVRASLTHWIRRHQAIKNSDDLPRLTGNLVQAALNGDLVLPSPGQQATNIIRFVGDRTRQSGQPMGSFPPEFQAAIGSINRRFAVETANELLHHGLLNLISTTTFGGYDAIDVRLTLAGWQAYEAEQKGQVSGNTAFIAMKFGDDVLESFLSEHIKPAIQAMGYELNTTRDASRVGIIDNLMRIDIRDSAFVLVDLTHDNSGAYWEAGYAEGLGKPVLYICEKSKFEQTQTHFDTSHSTTICWDATSPDKFKDELVATLRRSLVPK